VCPIREDPHIIICPLDVNRGFIGVNEGTLEKPLQ